MVNWPPPNSVILHDLDNQIKLTCYIILVEPPLLDRIVMVHTGLSVKDAIGIIARPLIVFFVSWTSSRRASPWLSGKLQFMLTVRCSIQLNISEKQVQCCIRLRKHY